MIKDPAFVDALLHWKAFSDELNERMSRKPSIASLDKEYEEQVLRMRTCPDCQQVCKNQWLMEYKHRGSKPCLERIATLNGETFVAKGRERIVCGCGFGLFRENLKRHQQGSLHKNKLARLQGFYCKPCDKAFSGKRPKLCYDQHCKGKKHLKRLCIAAGFRPCEPVMAALPPETNKVVTVV